MEQGNRVARLRVCLSRSRGWLLGRHGATEAFKTWLSTRTSRREPDFCGTGQEAGEGRGRTEQ
ncbi:hypothetical protein E2C01_069840 [Portunus trituberculatus]|uniref:Uncharacterized protein n=1 Tax=Portunus trituberculatus TaxID=210409 RepID=A0A5B7HVM2_PORTR|nr:hypothetical protein [Portunus trituberculatus]